MLNSNVNPNSSINVDDPAFLSNFTPLVQDSNGSILYHHNNLAPLPTRVIDPNLSNGQSQCTNPNPLAREAFYRALLQKTSNNVASSPTLPQPTATTTTPVTTPSPTTSALPNQPSINRPDFQTGIAFPQWASDAYGTTDVMWQKGLKDIRSQAGAKWIEIPILFNQASPGSTRVIPDFNTVSLTSFEQGIRTAHALGYRVFVTPLINVGGEDNWAVPLL